MAADKNEKQPVQQRGKREAEEKVQPVTQEAASGSSKPEEEAELEQQRKEALTERD